MLSESYRSFRKVCLAVGYTDLRKGIQGLSQLVGIKFDINSASERAAKTFVIGRKNWMLINSIKGAKAGATVYSICETAKANNLNPYYYLDHILTELSKLVDTEGKIATKKLDCLLPWSDNLPEKCYKQRRRKAAFF